MSERNQPIRVMAHLLVLAISFVQISTAVAVVVDLPDQNVVTHKQHNISFSKENPVCPHMNIVVENTDCCSASECAEKTCADKSCVRGAHSTSSAVFSSRTRIANRLFSKSRIELHNYLQVGISPESLYRPPR